MKKPPQWTVENGLGFDVGQDGVTTSRKVQTKKNRLRGRLNLLVTQNAKSHPV